MDVERLSVDEDSVIAGQRRYHSERVSRHSLRLIDCMCAIMSNSDSFDMPPNFLPQGGGRLRQSRRNCVDADAALPNSMASEW